jgi:putative flippase GtrA
MNYHGQETTGRPHDMPAAHVIFMRYVSNILISSLLNLASQEAVVRLVPLAPLMASVLTGTMVGFLVKYLLDKRWIFLDSFADPAAELGKITVYGIVSIGTTLLFWASELGFWYLWQTIEAKYLGAALGLSIGNWIKYLLDKRYVFPRRLT